MKNFDIYDWFPIWIIGMATFLLVCMVANCGISDNRHHEREMLKLQIEHESLKNNSNKPVEREKKELSYIPRPPLMGGGFFGVVTGAKGVVSSSPKQQATPAKLVNLHVSLANGMQGDPASALDSCVYEIKQGSLGGWLKAEISTYGLKYRTPRSRTASGTRYNYKEFTAATAIRNRKPVLPFGSQWEISYKGRSVIVTVTDTGSYRPSRAPYWLDLSCAAMAKLLGKPLNPQKAYNTRVIAKIRRIK